MNFNFIKDFPVGKSSITPCTAPLLVAETACAHDGDVEEAKKLVQGASFADADLIQLQIFRADEQVSPEHPNYKLLQSLELTDSEWCDIFDYATHTGKDVMAFVYDVPSIRLALSFNPCALKLNSSDLLNGSMLKACAESNLPLFLGTGASKIEEIIDALSFLQDNGCNKVILMHGVQDFPTNLSDSRLSRIRLLREIFGLPVGYGDHTDSSLEIAPYVDFLALGQGVSCLEKHITINRDLKKTDYQAALNAEQWKSYANDIRMAWSSLSDQCPLDISSTDIRYRQFQKKYAVLTHDIAVGSRIDSHNIKLLRVSRSDGISGLNFVNEKFYLSVKDLPKGHVLQLEDIKLPSD